MNENNNAHLSDDEIKIVTGGITPGAVEKLENDEACGSFICTMCGRDHSHHKIESDEHCREWVYTYDGANWRLEWSDHQLDCNHCKYFHHINYAFGECRLNCK